ncbi:MAG: hypothetical protein FOGNACKC_00863 [Anaerolineae bacterium]|nr:hypothetical protein [Anaerolineae bacterium]
MANGKTLRFDDDVVEVIRNQVQVWEEGGQWHSKMPQLSREMYQKVNKALTVAGGKWTRKTQTHVYREDPRPLFGIVADEGKVMVTNYDFYPTPPDLVETMAHIVWVGTDDPVLEPSAGEGAIADQMAQRVGVGNVYCVELNPGRAQILRDKGYTTVEADFLTLTPDDFGVEFAHVRLNPPFTGLQDVDHVLHAARFMALGGSLVAVMSESPFFQQTKKAKAFREWLQAQGGWSEPIDDGTFTVRTRLAVIPMVTPSLTVIDGVVAEVLLV